MGRHTRQEPGTPVGPRHPDAELVESLPGWGLFATVVAAVSLRWTSGDWPSVGAVTLLGLGTTAALWWSVDRGEQLRRLVERQSKVTITSRRRDPDVDAPMAGTAPRRVTP